MTRINVGVYPEELPDKQLLSEHREMKRIPNAIAKGRYNLNGIPKKFKLGEGHVKFFYNKLQFLLDRYYDVHEECLARGFNVTDYSGAWNSCPANLFGDYEPQDRDRELIIERLAEKGVTLLNGGPLP